MADRPKRKRKPKDPRPVPGPSPVEAGADADAAAPRPTGRPSRYRAEFCPQLVDHLRKGYSVESFASVAGVTREVVFRWAKKYPDFAEAKARGEAARELHYISMGQAIATGTLKVLDREEHVQDARGNVVRDTDGKPYINRIYRPAKCNAAAWIFLCKNMLGWKDKRDVNLSGSLDTPSAMTREEQIAEIERLHAQRKAAEGKWRE